MTIKEHYLKRAETALNEEWKRYFLLLSEWETSDTFLLSSIDTDSPLPKEFSIINDEGAAAEYARHAGIPFTKAEDLSLAFCQYNKSYYIIHKLGSIIVYNKLTKPL